jgi:hypothetical protein
MTNTEQETLIGLVRLVADRDGRVDTQIVKAALIGAGVDESQAFELAMGIVHGIRRHAELTPLGV